MSTVDTAVVRRAQEAVGSLHKGLGVLHPNLRKQLGSDLRLIWGIADHDRADRVLAVVTHQLRLVLESLRDERVRFIGKLTYNLLPHPELRREQLTRRRELASRYSSEPIGMRTLQRAFTDVVLREVRGSLANRPEPVPESVIADLIRSEQRKQQGASSVQPVSTEELSNARLALASTVAPTGRPDDGDLVGFQAVLRVKNGVSSVDEEAVRRFLGIQVHGCWTVDGGLPVARTAAAGDWVCVFSTPALLAEYRSVVGRRWSTEVFQVTGAELLRRLVDMPTPTGVLLNPMGQRDSAMVESFALPPAQVWELAGKTRSTLS